MTPRRRALLLGGLALLLGALAASDVAGREAALRRRLGPVVDVVVARGALRPGARLTPQRLALRAVPARYAPSGAFRDPAELIGLRAAVAVPAGADVVAGVVDDGAPAAPGAPVRAGERVAELVATGSPRLIQPGARVDVLVTRGGDGAPGGTELALEDVEVLAAAPASAAAAGEDGAPRVLASLRVTVRQAVYLAAAQAFARDIRLLPRAAGDDRRGSAGLAVDAGLDDR